MYVPYLVTDVHLFQEKNPRLLAQAAIFTMRYFYW